MLSQRFPHSTPLVAHAVWGNLTMRLVAREAIDNVGDAPLLVEISRNPHQIQGGKSEEQDDLLGLRSRNPAVSRDLTRQPREGGLDQGPRFPDFGGQVPE